METFGSKSEVDQRAPLLQTKTISYAYDRGLRALDKIDLSLREGSILAVMGANGSGKSTLLKCLIGLIKPAEGSITLRGQTTLDRTTVELSREIAYLPQYPDDLLFADTVSDELHITLSNHKLPADDNISNLLSDLHLLHEANAYPRDLSTGQRQRVALGAVMVTQPDVLLLDEPTRGLDGHLKQELAALWCAWRDRGMGIILATHDVELAAHIADEVLILEGGRQIASGPIKQILDSGSAFAPQIARLFPGKGWLTVDEAVIGLVDKRIQQASC